MLPENKLLVICHVAVISNTVRGGGGGGGGCNLCYENL